MKKSVVLCLLFVYLFSTTELHQFLKLPALVEHFSEHQQKDASVTLWKFLYMHYAYSNDHDNDLEKDSKLPFKTHDNCNNNHHVTVLPEEKNYLQNVCFIPKSTELHTYYTSYFSSSYLESIWQPPKFC
ncbi:hypothetical protein [Flavobacterium aciduliphilum]|uniref:Uncharacterized protein n=1 Tax=Flavobacterium aciduliphilum TaxID=1101402 RepID=A0A328YAI7_9FLAO|nr:hypothetical protein [Flavobacterium aciduliphilum]RAR70193.1 hypothetical protein CLV55_11117 [Flavobacterium aciduliphilum]